MLEKTNSNFSPKTEKFKVTKQKQQDYFSCHLSRTLHTLFMINYFLFDAILTAQI